MRYLVLILLVIAGIFLYQRAKRLATQERDGSAPEEESVSSVQDLKAKDAVENSVADTSITEPPINSAEIKPNSAEQFDTVHQGKTTEVIDAVTAPSAFDNIAVTEPTSVVGSAAIQVNEPTATAEALTKTSISQTSNLVAKPQSPASLSSTVSPIPDFASEVLSSALTAYHGAESSQSRLQALQLAIAECYRQRKDSDHLSFGAALGKEASKLCSEMAAKGVEIKGTLFMQISTLLNDAGDFDTAIGFCRQALALGLNDGTVTGFEGRINRIEKARDKAKA